MCTNITSRKRRKSWCDFINEILRCDLSLVRVVYLCDDKPCIASYLPIFFSVLCFRCSFFSHSCCPRFFFDMCWSSSFFVVAFFVSNFVMAGILAILFFRKAKIENYRLIRYSSEIFISFHWEASKNNKHLEKNWSKWKKN